MYELWQQKTDKQGKSDRSNEGWLRFEAKRAQE